MRALARSRTIRTLVPLLAGALLAAGCAGDVGKYRNVSARGGDVGSLAAASDEGPGGVAGGTDATGAAGGAAGAAGSAAGARSGPGGAGGGGSSGGGSGGGGGGGGALTGRTTGVTPTQITIALFHPKSGPYAAPGRNFAAAVQAAMDEANDQGGVNGRRLVLKTYDDAGGDANTITANHRRARDEAFAYMGTVSTTNEILAPLAERDRVPLIYGNIPEDLGKSLRYGFAAMVYWGVAARIMPSYIVNRLGARDKRIGVTFEDTKTASDAKDVFKAQAAQAGLNVVAEQSIGRTQATCTNEITNLQGKNVELVVMIHGPFSTICVLRDGRSLGFNPIWTGFGAIPMNVIAAGAGGAANGVSGLSSYTTLETEAGRRYSATMRKYASNSDAADDDLPIPMYGAAQLLVQGLRHAGPNLNSETFVRAMETKATGFDSGYLPPPTYGPGDRRGPLSMGVTRCCTDGRWTTSDTAWRLRF